MTFPRLDTFVLVGIVTCCLSGRAFAENEGMADLDEATQLKVTAETIPDINQVVDLLDSALEKGLDAENEGFAEQLLVSALLQRAQYIAAAILSRPLPDPRQDPRWIQVRQFALTDLQRAIEMDDSQWQAHMLVAELQSLPLGDVRAARRSFGKVTEAEGVPDADRAKAFALRGATLGDAEKRELDLDRAVELDPENSEYLRLRARHHYGQENYDRAIKDVDRALELEPEQASTHELRGMALLGQEKFDEAKESFARASELAPDAVLPYQHLGEVYRRQGDFQQAIEKLSKALELRPDDVATLLIRATVHYQSEDAGAAIADLDRVIELQADALNATTLKAHQLKAEILATEDRVDEAVSQLERLMLNAPDRPELAEVQYQLATYYLLDNRPKEAIAGFDQVLEWEPGNAATLRSRGDAYLAVGDHAKAIADFEKALAQNEEDQRLLNNLAWVLATSPIDEQRDGQRALELATKACELTAYQTPHILSTLAAAYAENGDFESAIKWSQQAVELGQDDPARAQLAEELASYKAGKPWREMQQVGGEDPQQPPGEPQPKDQTFAPPLAPRAPERTADF